MTLDNEITQSPESTPIQTAEGSSSSHNNMRKRTTLQDTPCPPSVVPPRIRSNTRRPTVPEAFKKMMTPERKVAEAPGFWRSVRSIITATWLNVLLLFIPVSWALHFALPENKNKDTIVFVTSFLAIVPLAKLLAFATDELSMRVGQTLAGLLNATLGNAVELIVAIIALVKCELQVVQASLVGSILSNLLLVLGMCFFAGGLKYSEQGFGPSASQLNSSLLTISVIAVLLQGAYHLSLQSTNNNSSITSDEQEDILQLSRGAAIILLVIYGAYLVFQLYSHPSLYDDNKTIKSTQYGEKDHRPMDLIKFGRHKKPEDPSKFLSSEPQMPAESHSIASANGDEENGNMAEAKNDDEEIPQMNVWMTIGLLVVVTVLVAVTAEWLVDSISGLTASGNIGTEFVGIILLPIVGNAAEHVTAVTVSVKDKLMLSIGVAVGSSIQIALFVIPFIVTLAWILGKPLTLLFDPYESITLFLAVMTVNYVVQDGKSNWLEGFILMCLYVILAVTFWFYPGSDPSGLTSLCT